MTIKAISPYINLNGQSEKAIQLYESALGARTEHVLRYADAPCVQSTTENKDLIMHASLRIGEAHVMLSDAMDGCPATTGQNVHIALEFGEPADMMKAFEALSVGGKVLQAICDAFWGAKFGMLTDAFGVRWLFNCTAKAA